MPEKPQYAASTFLTVAHPYGMQCDDRISLIPRKLGPSIQRWVHFLPMWDAATGTHRPLVRREHEKHSCLNRRSRVAHAAARCGACAGTRQEPPPPSERRVRIARGPERQGAARPGEEMLAA